MIALLSHRIECATPQKATALRDKLAQCIDEDPDVTLIASNYADDTEHEAEAQGDQAEDVGQAS